MSFMPQTVWLPGLHCQNMSDLDLNTQITLDTSSQQPVGWRIPWKSDDPWLTQRMDQKWITRPRWCTSSLHKTTFPLLHRRKTWQAVSKPKPCISGSKGPLPIPCPFGWQLLYSQSSIPCLCCWGLTANNGGAVWSCADVLQKKRACTKE